MGQVLTLSKKHILIYNLDRFVTTLLSSFFLLVVSSLETLHQTAGIPVQMEAGF